ncbi:MAG: Heterodisulfide reductase, B/C subunit [Promethearchaeota archaeon]|nr:MAG: Heterodisulfide reductase, B/C subunit [Candidatus Lokiarchaeota archaeon]
MIAYRLPFIEVSVKKVLDLFGIPYFESNKFSCCPEPNGIKNTNQLLYEVTASRNLGIAEKEGKDILTPCNGCFETLKGIRSEIKVDSHFRKKINTQLAEIDLHVEGISDVYHLIEFFHKLGRDVIKEKIQNHLNGLRIAVHYGCHFLRPSNKIQMDDPMEPHIFDQLIEDLGAKSVDYSNKMDCCGGSLARAGTPDSGLEMVLTKLESMKKERADVIVVGCPQCFIQFDHLQRDLKKLDYTFDIPVLYYSELLCIALGIDIKDMIRKYHRTQVDSIFDRIEEIQQKNKEIEKYFNVEFLKSCYSCGACNEDCPVAKYIPHQFNPQKIVKKILDGNIDKVIEDPAIWLCLDCYVCYELCPMKIGLVEVFTILRNLAKKRGFIAQGFQDELSTFENEGMVTLFSKIARQRVGLTANKPEIKDLKSLIKKLKNTNQQQHQKCGQNCNQN